MIPRLKPFLGLEEIKALFLRNKDDVQTFEDHFSKTFSTRHALAFSYGRSALWTFFKAMGIDGAEVVQPAYTCSVVAHATILSGNIPVFVDCTLNDYNMDLNSLNNALTSRTRVVLPTHLFGYPMDIDSISQIVADAERRFGHKIYVIQDCAHAFEAEWNGKSVITSGDGALFGLNISKQITSIFGGTITTDDEEIYQKLSIFRGQNFFEKSLVQKIARFLYLPTAAIAFNENIFGLTYWLQNNTSFLKRLTDAYHLDNKIHFPPDYLSKMSEIEARVGIEQLRKYPSIKLWRREIASQYFDQIKVPNSWILPPKTDGATYSHFVIRVPNRDQILLKAAQQKVQLGQLIEYSLPHMPAYRKYANHLKYPNSLLCSQSMINLPIYPNINQNIEKIINVVSKCRK